MMITLDEIMKMWEEDSLQFKNSIDIETDLMNIPYLHSKYLNFWLNEERELLKLKRAMKRYIGLRFDYYTGKIDQETLNKYNWQPYQYKILRGDISTKLESDEILLKLQKDIDESQTKYNMLKEIVNHISFSTQRYRAIIDKRKFEHGVGT